MADEKRAYVYATAANGMTVRIPADKLEQWQRAQDEIRAGKRQGEQQTAKQLRSLMLYAIKKKKTTL